MVLRILFFFSLSILLVTGRGQTGDFRISHYGTEDGLPSNGIKGLQWDKKTGFLWIATEAGLVRYNGMSFKTFTSDDNANITNERILFLVRNNEGVIFTADNTGNIFKVDNNILAYYEKANIFGNNRNNSISLAVSSGLYNKKHRFSTGNFSLQFDRILPLSDTSCFIQQGGKMYFFTISMTTPVAIQLSCGPVYSSFKCNNEVFIVDQKNTVWLLDKKTKALQKQNILFSQAAENPLLISSAFAWENGMGTPVLIYKKTAWKISHENGVLNIRLLCNVVPDDALIRFIQFDEENGTLFLGTDSKGIIIIRQNKVKSLRKTRVSVNERTSYYSQLELPDGNILTNEGHILGENKPGNFTYPGLQRFSISSYLMNDTVFWYTSFNKEFNGTFLHSYNLKTKKITIYSKVRENYSQLVMTTHSGVLYLANEFGISRLQGDSLLMLYRYDKVSRSNIHFDIKETAPGILTLASCNALTRFDISTGKLDTIFVPGNYCVRTLWQYKDYLFFGTYGNGLYISKGGVVKALPLDKNKYLLFTHCFVDDKNGFCWISTNHGLFKASIQDMISAYEQTAPQVYYHYFGRNDGMNMTEMNGGCLPCALMMKNGTISFPTMEGLLWVKPNAAAPVMPGGEIYIDKIIVDNKNADVAAFEETTLSPRKHDLELRLGFSAWCNKENIYLEYSLGDNKEWRQINENNEAVLVLNNLSPGDYLLRIRKLNGFGPNNYSYKELRFRIGTPWYQKWWFYLGCVVFIAGLILIYLNFRTRQYKSRQLKLEQQVADKTRELQEQNQVLEKNNSIKTRLISIISHDIVTPLKFLNAAGKNLMEKRKIMPDELQQETIQEITNTSQELQLLSTNILNWIKYQNENRRLAKEVFNLHELVEQVLGILQSLARQKNLVIKNEIAGSQEINQYYEPIKILVYNLLTNAIQFTEKGVIAVNATQNGSKLTLSVKDEGIGMTAEQVQRILADEVVITAANVDNKKGHGLGYLIIKDLLKTVGASLQINSKRGWGTTVSITMNA